MKETFGKLLKEASAKTGVSHSELARRMGVTQHRIPSMFQSPSITERTFRRAAKALGVDIEVKLVARRKS
jgi:plasmid maintenance system antidote protein VapI